MIDVSTKNSVKKGSKCEYTFFTGKEWLKVITKLDSTSKCTYYDGYNYIKGKVNALMDRHPDVGNVHSKRLSSNCVITPELTRAFSGPKLLQIGSKMTVIDNLDKFSSFLHKKRPNNLTNIMRNTFTQKNSHLFRFNKLEAHIFLLDLLAFSNRCRAFHSNPSKNFTHLSTGSYRYKRTLCSMYKKCRCNDKSFIMGQIKQIKRHFFFDNLLNFLLCIIQKTSLNNHNHTYVKFYNGIRKSMAKNSMFYKKLLYAVFQHSKSLKQDSRKG